ncbi:MAG: TonB-dependent receptor [Woeseia sp.]
MPHAVVALAPLIFIPDLLRADEVLEEIIVRADFRERAAAELPPSITVLDRATIEQSAVQHFEELVFAVPNLNYSGDGQRARYFQIRGIGELEQYEGAPNPSVGFLIDDIDFSGIATIATLFDVEQVEVLRGPQGTRYGANALAGLIYVQSAAPTDEWGGRAQLTAGSDDALAGGVAFGGPLIQDQLAFRVAAHRHASNGFRNNAFLRRDDTNGREESMLRGRLDWRAGESWLLRLTAMAVDIDDGYDAFAIDNSLTVQSDQPGRDAQRSRAASLRAAWNGAERFELTSISSYADSSIDFSFDADWGNALLWAPYTYDFISASERQRRTLSQELRVASTESGRLFNDSADWLVGLYAMRLNDGLATLNRGDYADPVFNFSFAVDDRFDSDFEATTVALFGELDIEIAERGLLTVGLRTERRTTRYRDSAQLSLGPSESMLGGELRYRFDISDDVSLFAAAARGYKAGGFNLGVVPAERREFAQETLWNFEAGMRARWLDGDLLFNSLVFVNSRRDQQVRTSFQLVPNDPASFVFFTDNAASGRSLGLETDLSYRVNDSLTWHFSAGLLQAEFAEFRTPQVDLGGRDQAHAPRYTLATGASWRAPSGFFARLDVQARDEFYFDVSHDQKSQPYELVNARIGYDAQHWQLQLWARNLLDESHAVRGFYFGNEPPDFPDTLYIRQGDPRQLGVTFDMRF